MGRYGGKKVKEVKDNFGTSVGIYANRNECIESIAREVRVYSSNVSYVCLPRVTNVPCSPTLKSS